MRIEIAEPKTMCAFTRTDLHLLRNGKKPVMLVRSNGSLFDKEGNKAHK